MNIDLSFVYTGGRLNNIHDFVLYILGYLNYIAAVRDGDYGIYLNGIINNLNLDALGNGLDTHKLGDFGTGSIGKTGNALHIGNCSSYTAGDNFLGDINAAIFLTAGNVILTHFNSS